MRLIFIVLILATAGALGLIAFQIANPRTPAAQVAASQAPPAPVLPVRVIVAARELPPGTLLRAIDLTAKPFPRDLVKPDAMVDDDEARAVLLGALVQRGIATGAPITTADLLRNRDRGFLSAVLAPGTRAVSIGVDPITGVSGLIWPGDHVDVILTQEIQRATEATGRRIIGETVLSNVRVIAIDQDITQGTPQGSSVAGKLASTVTLQANADEAERLAVAQQMGHLSLAIRAFSDTLPSPGRNAPLAAVTGDDVSPALSNSKTPGRPRVVVIQGDQRSEVTFR